MNPLMHIFRAVAHTRSLMCDRDAVARSELRNALETVGLRGIRVFLRKESVKAGIQGGLSCPLGPPAPPS